LAGGWWSLTADTGLVEKHYISVHPEITFSCVSLNTLATRKTLENIPNKNCNEVSIYGPPKKCIHTLTKENSMLYVRTNYNYTSQVEYTLQ